MTASDEQVERLARAVYVSIDHDDDDWPDESPEYRRYWTDMATGFLAALPAAGLAVVGADRWERVRRAAEAAYTSVNAPYDPAHDGGEQWAAAEQALVRAVNALDPGDLASAPAGDGDGTSSSTP
jgi:hypothetical protein